jgi:hypothetical protein
VSRACFLRDEAVAGWAWVRVVDRSGKPIEPGRAIGADLLADGGREEIMHTPRLLGSQSLFNVDDGEGRGVVTLHMMSMRMRMRVAAGSLAA